MVGAIGRWGLRQAPPWTTCSRPNRPSACPLIRSCPWNRCRHARRPSHFCEFLLRRVLLRTASVRIMGMRVFVFAARPGDDLRAGRTLRAMAGRAIVVDATSLGSAQLAGALMSGPAEGHSCGGDPEPAWLVGTGRWPRPRASLELPRASTPGFPWPQLAWFVGAAKKPAAGRCGSRIQAGRTCQRTPCPLRQAFISMAGWWPACQSACPPVRN